MDNQKAHLHIMGSLAEAAHHSSAGYWTADDHGFHLKKVIGEIEEVAGILGFDLVKRQSPQEAHDTMLAKLRAEDGQAEETVGFR